METKCQYLQFVPYATIRNWSVQYMKGEGMFSSIYPIKPLEDCLKEENERYSISDSSCEYGILGVNNQNGIFDAYTENGAKIKQKYKKMEVGWIAYNPYRINVGSVGVKRDYHKNDYISPAYVVFSCKEGLLPDFLYLIMRTPTFNQIIRKNTTGSVRQSLSFKNLKDLKIPLPRLEEQKELITAYSSRVNKSLNLYQSIDNIQRKCYDYVRQTLFNEGANKGYEQGDALLKLVHFKDIIEWGISNIKKRACNGVVSKYNIAHIKDVCKVNSGGTPSRSNKSFYEGNIPWIKTGEVLNDIIYDTEEHISEEAIESSSARIYPKGSLIIAMYGQGGTRGRSAKLGIDASTNQACAVLHQIDNDVVLTDYLWAYIQAMYDDLRSLASGTNQPNLNAEKIKNYMLPLPPKETQEEIVSYVKTAKERMKALKAEAESLKAQALLDFEKALFKKQ